MEFGFRNWIVMLALMSLHEQSLQKKTLCKSKYNTNWWEAARTCYDSGGHLLSTEEVEHGDFSWLSYYYQEIWTATIVMVGDSLKYVGFTKPQNQRGCFAVTFGDTGVFHIMEYANSTCYSKVLPFICQLGNNGNTNIFQLCEGQITFTDHAKMNKSNTDSLINIATTHAETTKMTTYQIDLTGRSRATKYSEYPNTTVLQKVTGNNSNVTLTAATPTTSTSIKTPTERVTKTKGGEIGSSNRVISKGMIAGITSGAVVVCIIIGVAIFLCHRKRKILSSSVKAKTSMEQRDSPYSNLGNIHERTVEDNYTALTYIRDRNENDETYGNIRNNVGDNVNNDRCYNIGKERENVVTEHDKRNTSDENEIIMTIKI